MSMPHPIPYQGSKRKLAEHILSFFPDNVETLIEPFAGSAAISIAAAAHGKAQRFLLGDINAPLMALWQSIIENPGKIARDYQEIWLAQHQTNGEYYYQIRDQFNENHRPEHLLFLLVRCVKASVRYNADGEFNQSPDKRRKGTHPNRMEKNILQTSFFFKGRTEIFAGDYGECIKRANIRDLIYMDPPYQGVCRNRDPRYIESVQYENFVRVLQGLNDQNISYMVSYDGRTGDQKHGKSLPDSLDLERIEIDAGRSSQATLLGRKRTTYESLYLSSALLERIEDRVTA
jgi:DNA adenine methylase